MPLTRLEKMVLNVMDHTRPLMITKWVCEKIVLLPVYSICLPIAAAEKTYDRLGADLPRPVKWLACAGVGVALLLPAILLCLLTLPLALLAAFPYALQEAVFNHLFVAAWDGAMD